VHGFHIFFSDIHHRTFVSHSVVNRMRNQELKGLDLADVTQRELAHSRKHCLEHIVEKYNF
jgi:hypothetical protein